MRVRRVIAFMTSLSGELENDNVLAIVMAIVTDDASQQTR
jgi:hypothetical protein